MSPVPGLKLLEKLGQWSLWLLGHLFEALLDGLLDEVAAPALFGAVIGFVVAAALFVTWATGLR